MSDTILDELIKKITSICRTPDELKGIPVYVSTDKYRQKIIDFIDAAELYDEPLTADQLLLFTILISNEEKEEYK